MDTQDFEGVPHEVVDRLESLESALTSGSDTVSVGTGPMSDGPERDVTVDYVDSVSARVVRTPDMDYVEIVVGLDLERFEYAGPIHGNAVYAAMEQHGINRPDDSPHHGVRFQDRSVTVSNYVEV